MYGFRGEKSGAGPEVVLKSNLAAGGHNAPQLRERRDICEADRGHPRPAHGPRDRRGGPASAGAIVETAVLGELVKAQLGQGREARIHFWRASTGSEVGFLVEGGGRLIPIEIKASSTPRPAMAAGTHALRSDLGDLLGPGYVVHTGESVLPLGDGMTAVPVGLL